MLMHGKPCIITIRYIAACFNFYCSYQLQVCWNLITDTVLEMNRPEVIRLFSCSTQLSTKFHLPVKTKIRYMKKFLALSLSDVVVIMLISVKMPIIVGILTFMSRINFVLS